MKKTKINSHGDFLSNVSQVLIAMNVIDHFEEGHIVTHNEMKYIEVIKDLRKGIEEYFSPKKKENKKER